MKNMDNKLDALTSPAYQKMMKKNKHQKYKKKIKEIGIFIITNILIPIVVSIITTLIVGL